MDQHVFWMEIHRLCREVERLKLEGLGGRMAEWFRVFPEEKDMNFKDIPSLPASLCVQRSCEAFEEALVNTSRAATKNALNGKNLPAPKSQDEDDARGIWKGWSLSLLSPRKDSWVGFLLKEDGGIVVLKRWVEFSVDKSVARVEELKQLLAKEKWEFGGEYDRLYWNTSETVAAGAPCSESEDWITSKIKFAIETVRPMIEHPDGK